MVLSVASSLARRRIAMLAKQPQKRFMGGGASTQEWEGVDKVVRGVFPKDWQLAVAIMGGYGGLYVLYKIKSAISGKKAPAEEPAPAKAASSDVATTGVPSVGSPEFDQYIETDAFYKMLDNDEQLGKVLADMK